MWTANCEQTFVVMNYKQAGSKHRLPRHIEKQNTTTPIGFNRIFKWNISERLNIIRDINSLFNKIKMLNY